MPDELEQCPCPLCGRSELTGVHYDFTPYRVVQCAGCGLWYLSPRLNETAMLAHYSSNTYFEGSDGLREGYSDYALQEQPLRVTFRRFLKRLHRMGITGGALLEVGCGYGYLLSEARPYFERRVGTDFSDTAVNRASTDADAVYLGGVDALPEGERFDAIIAVEVIEHIYDPNRFVAGLADRLKPGGHLIMATPDMGSLWRRLLGRYWPSFKLPEHVTYYGRETLTELLKRHGFDAPCSIPFPHAFPLAVVLEKLGIRLRSKALTANIWIPGVVLSMAARLK